MDFVIFGSKEKVSRNGVPLQKTSSIYYIYIIYILYPKKILSPKLLSQQKNLERNPLHQRTDEEDFALFSFPLALLPSFPFPFTEGRKNDRASRSLPRSKEEGRCQHCYLASALSWRRPTTDWRNDRLKRTNRRNVPTVHLAAGGGDRPVHPNIL